MKAEGLPPPSDFQAYGWLRRKTGSVWSRQIKTIYRNYGFTTQIITAAARHPLHVLQAALAGSDVITMGFDILQQLYQHPLTDSVLDTFLKDWAKIPGK